jgi:phosphate transport system protein
MKHTETELIEIKNSISEMWNLVQSQLNKAKNALITSDLDLARVVISFEKRVNALELKIDSECENYIALFSPVAIDLRLVLSVLKINKTLERIGDFAEGIARFVIDNNDRGAHKALIEDLHFEEMVGYVEQMLNKTLNALNDENTAHAGLVFSIDNLVDNIYSEAITYLAKYVVEHPEDALYVMHILTVIRKVERCGDHCNNIMEEIVFYLDAKVLKHQKK